MYFITNVVIDDATPVMNHVSISIRYPDYSNNGFKFVSERNFIDCCSFILVDTDDLKREITVKGMDISKYANEIVSFRPSNYSFSSYRYKVLVTPKVLVIPKEDWLLSQVLEYKNNIKGRIDSLFNLGFLDILTNMGLRRRVLSSIVYKAGYVCEKEGVSLNIICFASTYIRAMVRMGSYSIVDDKILQVPSDESTVLRFEIEDRATLSKLLLC